MSIVTANKRLVEYPFPSITICNQNKISKTKLLRLLNENSRYAQLFSVHQLLLMMSVLMQLHTANHQTQSELHEIDRIMNENGISVTEAVNMTLQVIKKFLSRAKMIELTFFLLGNSHMRRYASGLHL